MMTRKPCTHCQRPWHAQSLVTVGAAELCPICYKAAEMGTVVAVQKLHAGDRQDADLSR